MALCSSCLIYKKEYDEFRADYNDSIPLSEETPEQHFCSMYDDHIPNNIYHKGADCPYYIKK